MMFGKKKTTNQSLVPVSENQSLANVPAKGSLATTGKNTALALLNAKAILVIDRSGSMEMRDAMGGRARYEVEDEAVANLQAEYPGQLIITAFADSAIICIDGNLPYPNGSSTILTNAFKLAARLRRGQMRVILLTDGEAQDSEQEILESAKPLIGYLDIVYIGSDHGAGRGILGRLAKYASGTFQNSKIDTKLLENTVETLMLKSGKK